MKLLFLGGYGAVGIQAARIVAGRADVEIVIAGRNLNRARRAAEKLSRETGNARIAGASIDAKNYQEVVAAFKQVDWAIICIPLTGHGSKLAQAALDTGAHYLDINANKEKQSFLQAMARYIKRQGLCFVSEAGCLPGLPSLLVRHAHHLLGRLSDVSIGSMFRDLDISYGSAYDLLVELGAKHRVFEGGAWRRAALSETMAFDFGDKLGVNRCYPFELLELVKLPLKEMGIHHLGLYAAGFNPVVDMVVMTWVMTRLHKSEPGLHLGAKLAMWAGKFTQTPSCTLVQACATAPDGRRVLMRISHENAYIATAIPLAACIIQMLESKRLSSRGLHLMGHFLEPAPFLDLIRDMGMTVDIDLQG